MSAASEIGLPELYLIRHGETPWSLSGRHTGRTDIALTERGEEMARGLQPILEPVTFVQVLTSPRDRARRTCELAGLGDAARVDPDLAEWDYGDYEGMHTVEIRKSSPSWNVFRDGCPGGESPGEVSARADRVLSRLRTAHGSVALFSHGQFGCALAARWIELPVAKGVHFSLDPASLSILGPKPGHPDVPVIAHWNNVPGGSRVRPNAGLPKARGASL